MEFGIKKYIMLIIISRYRQMTGGIELPNQEKKSECSEKRKLTHTSKYGSGCRQTSGDEAKI